MDILPNEDLFEGLRRKSIFKQGVYQKTAAIFKQFKETLSQMGMQYNETYEHAPEIVPFKYRHKGDFACELEFGSDILVFMMHSNIFEFSRDHEVMKTAYVRDDISRSYCGQIMIFNFLSDSFRYGRSNDLGYLIGRIFINDEQHYFIEGKREIGMLYNNFQSSEMTDESISQIIDSAIRYTVNFDLLTPPFDAVKEITVQDMENVLDSTITTGKRIGFRFQGDHEEINR